MVALTPESGIHRYFSSSLKFVDNESHSSKGKANRKKPMQKYKNFDYERLSKEILGNAYE